MTIFKMSSISLIKAVEDEAQGTCLVNERADGCATERTRRIPCDTICGLVFARAMAVAELRTTSCAITGIARLVCLTT